MTPYSEPRSNDGSRVSIDYAAELHASAARIADPPRGRHTPTTVVAGGRVHDNTIHEDPMRQALLAGQVSFPPNGWLEDWWFYVKNNHVLISCILAHPSHPYTRGRRFLVLLHSLSFAFFVVAFFMTLIPSEVLRQTLMLVWGTLWQLLWDVPASMLGTCACAHLGCLPVAVRRVCACASFGCLACHTLLGFVFAAVGALILLLLPPPEREELVGHFVQTKLAAFATAIIPATLIYSVIRCCEQRRRTQDAGML